MLNIEENITRKTDLANEDSLSAFKNHAAQQSHNAYRVFYDFLAEVNPSQILEIGTGLGGFTSFLKICCDDLELSTSILSFDIHEKSWFDETRAMGIDIRIEDVFLEDYTGLRQDIIEYIQSDGTTIVLCDGGNKINEFKTLSEHIKINDFIMAHDYVEDTNIFREKIYQKIWNWCEITENDISPSCEKYNLTDYKKEEFNNAVWVCKQKQS
jgi:hypothetical protein